jgi:2-dehydropantoate 2-reductase
MDGERSDRAERFLELCERADGMEAELSESIRTALWEKAAFICAQAGMSASVRLPVGDIRDQGESWEMYRRIVEEVTEVGRAVGVDVPEGTVERWMEFAADLDPDSYSSLHYDMTHDKPMELEALHGTVVRHGRENEVAVPMNEAVYAILRPWAESNRDE